MHITQIPLGSVLVSNAFVLQERGKILVDTGAEPGEEAMLSLCRQAGIHPSDIGLIVVTHAHPDHIMNLKAAVGLSGAPILCTREAAPYVESGEKPPMPPRNEEARKQIAFRSNDEPLPPIAGIRPDIVINAAMELDAFGVAGRVVSTPGHSECSLSVLLDSGEAIVGDIVMRSPFDGTLSLPLIVTDFDKLFESLAYLLDHAEKFYVGHGGPYSRNEVLQLYLRERETHDISCICPHR